MIRKFSAQLSVIKALAIRDFQSANANLSYGYVWAAVDIVMSIGIILLLKLFIHGLSPPNVPPVMFLLLAAMPWFMFSTTAVAMMNTLSAKKRFLSLPGVTGIDLLASKAVSVFCTYGSLFLVAVIVSSYFEGSGLPANAAGLALVYVSAWLLGIGLGMVLMPIVRVFPPGGKFIAPIWRFGLLLSGVYFSPSTLPGWSWPYLSWNPMMHVSELMREYWFPAYVSPIANPVYIALWVPLTLFFGLSIERYIRHRIPI